MPVQVVLLNGNGWLRSSMLAIYMHHRTVRNLLVAVASMEPQLPIRSQTKASSLKLATRESIHKEGRAGWGVALAQCVESEVLVVIDGSEADAFVRAVQANIKHGLPLSLRDRKAAAARIVYSHPWWSNRAIASVTGLSPKTVAGIRRSTGESAPGDVRVGRDGRARHERAVDALNGSLASIPRPGPG